MAYILIKHRIDDFDKWKRVFDEHDSTREEYGQQGYQVFRLSDDACEVVVLLEWASSDEAKAFVEESDLEAVMAEGTVMGEPDIYFLDEVDSKVPTSAT